MALPRELPVFIRIEEKAINALVVINSYFMIPRVRNGQVRTGATVKDS